jgi:hypothetical protein
MSLYYRSLIQNGLLLDIYPNATVAYSLRKLRNAYSGSLIRVRRGIDSIEQDIPFLSNGNLDTTNVEDFCGYNLATFSQDISNTVWTKLNLNTTSTPTYLDVAVAPDSTTTADKMIDTAVSGIHRVSRTLSSTAGTIYNISVYLKAGERRYVQIQGNITGANQIMNVDLQTGTISSNSFSNANLTSVGNGWYRFDYTSIAVGGSPTVLLVSMQLTSGGTTTYIGDGLSGIYIWGYQVSQTSSVKTYQITTSVAGGTGFIQTWYDQSGNGNNLTNNTPSLQYRIVVNNNVTKNTDNNLPTSQVVSTGFYNLSSSISTLNPLVNFNVYKSAASPSNMILFGNNTVGGRPVANLHSGGVGSRFITLRLVAVGGGNDISVPFETNGSFITSTTRDTSNYAEVSVNNSVVGGGALGVSTSANFTVVGRFNSSANGSGGEIQEMIIWKQNYVSIKSNISNKINEYYAIY